MTTLPVGEIASADALLFLRAPDEWRADAIKLIERWGFRYGSLVWVGIPGSWCPIRPAKTSARS